MALAPADEAVFRGQLGLVTEFLDLRLRARDRRRQLRFRPPFAELRPGQEAVQARARVRPARAGRRPFFSRPPPASARREPSSNSRSAQLRAGHFERVIYLTGKSTGQLQVVQTLATMTGARPATSPEPAAWSWRRGWELRSSDNEGVPGKKATVAVGHVRSKSEHCVNHTFHCVRDGCVFLDDIEARWPQSGLARFYLFENQARELEALRAAGLGRPRICPYEITRAALAFQRCVDRRL